MLRSSASGNGLGADIGANQRRLAGVAVCLIAAALVATLFLLLSLLDISWEIPYPYLLPWILLELVVVVVVAVVSLRNGLAALSSPLMYATGLFFFPAFVVGGICFAVGWSSPEFASLIRDPASDLPFAMQVVIIGHIGLAIGYFLPPGRRLANLIFKRFSYAERPPSDLIFPSSIFLAVGWVCTFASVWLGIGGFQRDLDIGTFDGLIYLVSIFTAEATFLLSWIAFRRNRFDLPALQIGILLLATIIFTTFAAGSRGNLPSYFLLIGFAYLLSGRRVTPKKGLVGGICLVAIVVAGMIWGTTFRSVKGSERKVDIDEYAEIVSGTLEKIATTDTSDSLALGFSSLALRLDTVSSVAVVVSNYEALAPYEKGYGLSDNIVRDMTIPFIPRVVWPNRPEMSDARLYAALYFEFGDNSFAVTPMVDLLRNFGIPGVFVGMAVLGLILRFIFAALIEGQKVSLYRSTLYYVLLTAVSYEGFYGTIFPQMVKIGLVAFAGIVFVEIIAGKRRNAWEGR